MTLDLTQIYQPALDAISPAVSAAVPVAAPLLAVGLAVYVFRKLTAQPLWYPTDSELDQWSRENLPENSYDSLAVERLDSDYREAVYEGRLSEWRKKANGFQHESELWSENYGPSASEQAQLGKMQHAALNPWEMEDRIQEQIDIEREIERREQEDRHWHARANGYNP